MDKWWGAVCVMAALLSCTAPANAEIQRTFDTCKAFIEATRLDEKTVEVAADAA